MTHTALPLSRMNKIFPDIIDNYNVITAFLIANAGVKIKMQHKHFKQLTPSQNILFAKIFHDPLGFKVSFFSEKSFSGISSAIFEPSQEAPYVLF